MMANMKCINDKIRANRAENKVKQSNIVYNLVNDFFLFFLMLEMVKKGKNTCAW